MKEMLSASTYERFKDAIVTGDDLSKADKNEIADAMFKFSTARGAVNFAHTFYPVRASGTGLGGTTGMKHDGFVDLEYGSKLNLKPIKTEFSGSRLFTGETDGSSFPNG